MLRQTALLLAALVALSAYQGGCIGLDPVDFALPPGPDDPFSPPTGACCVSDESCQDGLSEEECTAAVGTYQGDDTLCSDTDCGSPPPDEPPPDEPPPDEPPDTGSGTATFSEILVEDLIRHGQDVDTVDLDGDGDLDILVALSFTDQVRAYLNDGTGQPWTVVPISAPGAIVAMDVSVGDIDGDGDLDIAAVGLIDRNQGFSSPGEVAWYENPGDVTGNWTAHQVSNPRFSFWGARSIQCVDVTGNGLADLVVGAVEMETGDSLMGNGLYWIRNEEAGTDWSEPIPVDAGLQGVETVLRHDVDGDGVEDIVALGRLGSEIAWYRMAGGLEWEPTFQKHVIATPLMPYHIALANLDEDADLELVATSPGNSQGIVWYDPPADPTLPWTQHSVDAAFNGSLARIAAADFDRDGRTDVAVASNGASELRLYLWRPDDGGWWMAQTIMSGYGGLTDIEAADLDGDNRPDLITTTDTYEYGTQQDRVSWWRNQP